jgi:hypothetical protein
MCRAFLAGDPFFAGEEMARLETLPQAAHRIPAKS